MFAGTTLYLTEDFWLLYLNFTAAQIVLLALATVENFWYAGVTSWIAYETLVVPWIAHIPESTETTSWNFSNCL